MEPMKVVEPDMNADDVVQYGRTDFEDFGGRIPIIYHPESRTIYMGGPNWFHYDTADHHGIDEYSGLKGFVGGGPQWSNGKLSWYSTPPAEHNQINEALEKVRPGISAPKVDPAMLPPEEEDDDWMEDDISGLHHPRP